jgi:hypothetical protein
MFGCCRLFRSTIKQYDKLRREQMKSINVVAPALSPEVRACLKALPNLQLEVGSRHPRVVNIQSGDFLPGPGPSSDRLAVKALCVGLRRLASGRGFTFAKKRAAALAIAVFAVAASPASAGLCDLITGAAAKGAAAASGATVATGAGLTAFGVSAVAHSSGAFIATAGGSYLGGTLGAIGATVGVLTAPATLAAGGLVLVGVGGTAAYCSLTRAPQ